MKVFVYLTGHREPVHRRGTKCHKSVTYEWELPNVTMFALTRLREDLSEHVKSGIAQSLIVGKEDIDGEYVNVIRVVLKKPVLRGTTVMVNTVVKRALKQ